ncbi:Aldolase-type TIM barrel family protein [Hibiscus syriacus]|uniref:Aldolase-type TIM barrel family protein n=1 Tax=Hibiscus syriacus TaxID=106335 RepID=A0A6A2Y011_HIBSY|nr:uncharacterized protein LOC120166102 [Hibiscus syriacus]XP_039031397.1 uncharacterized protein LOC120166102 [Hibiscus syriacus]KAE8676310.1 Aldolase-type TIM barrel family protein [Hibiscus syriacus]
MSQSGASHSLDTTDEDYDMEFRSYPDDAWYSVRLLLEGDRSEKLRIKYDNFPDDIDDVFPDGNFKSEDEIHDFVGRIRKVSAQLQDHDCLKVVKGMRVCASDTFADGEVLFYDAIVDDILRKEHSNLNGQEECNCIFLLFWLHGPNVGNVSNKGVANICLLQDSELHPKVATFMEIAIRNSEKASCKFVSGTTSNDPVVQLKENNSSPIVKQKRRLIGNLRQGKYVRRSLSEVWPSKGENCNDRQDTDVGGGKKLYLILVQNLEKELSSLAVSKFIYKQTSIATQVYIFPSLPWEPYANGVIMLDCKRDVEGRLFDFLQNPNHFIVSSNGRPWVAAEKCQRLIIGA